MVCILGLFYNQVGFASLVRLYVVPYLVSLFFFIHACIFPDTIHCSSLTTVSAPNECLCSSGILTC
jgi:hypothetical protein